MNQKEIDRYFENIRMTKNDNDKNSKMDAHEAVSAYGGCLYVNFGGSSIDNDIDRRKARAISERQSRNAE